MKYLAILASLLIFANSAFACTDFQLKSLDGAVVVGRSMEFAMGMNSEVVVYPRGQKAQSQTPEGKKGLGWTSKYGFLALNALGMKEAVVDGINEAGLSVEFLWFTESRYSTNTNKDFLMVTDLGPWILGNFSTVDEVKEKLTGLPVVGAYVPELKSVPGFHAAVHDAQGNNLVVEFINGKTMIYDNPIGVMTNKPTFDWQLTNLRNYVNLTPFDQENTLIRGQKFEEAGSGSGWKGLPGDWTPPSRFVRTAMMVNSANQPKNALEAVNLAEHILNANDIPLGVIKTQKADPNLVDYTQWVVIKDLTNRSLYYRSYQDLTLKRVDLNRLNLAPGAEMKTLRLEDGSRNIIDSTDKLK